MSISEKDAILRERAAFEKGAEWGHHIAPLVGYQDAEAQRRYPLPKVTRPREKKDCAGVRWRALGSTVQWCLYPDGNWNDVDTRGCGAMYLTVERVILIADLLANPTEEVDG